MDPQQQLEQNQAALQQPLPPAKSGGKGWMIFAIILILLLIAVGAYGYSRIKSLNSSLNAQQAQTADAQNQLSTLQNANNTLKITEFGIQMPKPTDAKEAFYKILKNSEGTEFAAFSSPALQAFAAQNPQSPVVNNQCGLNSSPLGTITKNKAGTLIKGVKVEDVKDSDLLVVKKQDVFYYTYVSPIAFCSTVKSVQELQTKQANSLRDSFKNMTAIQ